MPSGPGGRSSRVATGRKLPEAGSPLSSRTPRPAHSQGATAPRAGLLETPRDREVLAAPRGAAGHQEFTAGTRLPSLPVQDQPARGRRPVQLRTDPLCSSKLRLVQSALGEPPPPRLLGRRWLFSRRHPGKKTSRCGSPSRLGGTPPAGLEGESGRAIRLAPVRRAAAAEGARSPPRSLELKR